jgi:hypothetical protein
MTNDTIDFIDTEHPGKGVQRWEPASMATACPPASIAVAPSYALGLRSSDDTEIKRIAKPTRYAQGDKADASPAWRTPECTGRLTLGTGCGHCLRCNREWYVLLNQPGTAWKLRDGALHLEHWLAVGDTENLKVKGVLREPTHVGREPSKSSVISREEARKVGYAVLDACEHGYVPNTCTSCNSRLPLDQWVASYNAAVDAHDTPTMARLNIALRSIEFPPGVDLVRDATTMKQSIIRRESA